MDLSFCPAFEFVQLQQPAEVTIPSRLTLSGTLYSFHTRVGNEGRSELAFDVKNEPDFHNKNDDDDHNDNEGRVSKKATGSEVYFKLYLTSFSSPSRRGKHTNINSDETAYC